MADSDSPRKGGNLMDLGRAVAVLAGTRLREGIKDVMTVASEPREQTLKTSEPEPPVVARLVVEIRSDGLRTIARGVLEDTATNQTAAVRAEGTTPAQLARSLAASLVTLPLTAARMARSLKKGSSE